MLHINDLTFRIEGRPLFEQATLAVLKGSKVGLVGRNGTGKSTLFNLIKGSLSPDDGSVNLRKGARLGAVDQEVPSGPESLMETVISANKCLYGRSESRYNLIRPRLHTRRSTKAVQRILGWLAHACRPRRYVVC